MGRKKNKRSKAPGKGKAADKPQQSQETQPQSEIQSPGVSSSGLTAEGTEVRQQDASHSIPEEVPQPSSHIPFAGEQQEQMVPVGPAKQSKPKQKPTVRPSCSSGDQAKGTKHEVEEELSKLTIKETTSPNEPPEEEHEPKDSAESGMRLDENRIPQEESTAPELAVSPPSAGQASETKSDPASDLTKWKKTEEEIKEELFKHRIENSPFPRRPKSTSASSEEKKIDIVSNCYNIRIPRGLIYHYDVEITSPKHQREKQTDKKKYRRLSNKLNRRIMQAMFQGHRVFKNVLPVYDGKKNMYTNKPLEIQDGTFKTSVTLQEDSSDRNPRSSMFDVEIKFVAFINLESLHELYRQRQSVAVDISNVQDAIMAVNVILCHGPSLVFTPIGRSLFPKPTDPRDVYSLRGSGKEVWFGYRQSVRLGQWKPMLVINSATTVFFSKQPLLEFVKDYLARARKKEINHINEIIFMSSLEIKNLSKELKGISVRVNHLKYRRKYRIERVSYDTPDKLYFPKKAQNGAEIQTSVLSHFQSEYGGIKYPNLPCLQMQNSEKNVYLPMEVCDIEEGQHCKSELSDRDKSTMIKNCGAVPPAQRFNDIKDSVNLHCKESGKWLSEFGIQIDKNPIEVREVPILEAPQILYDQKSTATPQEGVWWINNNKFLSGATIKKWVIISFANEHWFPKPKISDFARNLKKWGRDRGMKIPDHDGIMNFRRPRRDPNKWIQNLFGQLKNDRVDLAVIILEKRDGFHGEVKRAGDTQVGLITQCVICSSISDKPAFMNHLLQKINTKMGGLNHSIPREVQPAILQGPFPVIVIGVDVNHPAPSERGRKPSIAAAVASMDPYLFRYAATVRIQQSQPKGERGVRPVEIIKEFKDMVKELLFGFYKNIPNALKPEKIIVYRDGVSEGQFIEVRNEEIQQIRKACRELQADGYEPSITFVVVQKGHNTRFKPTNRKDGVGKCGNIPPGTTIDKEVVHPTDYDFYLCSHFGIQGTSRPSHYYVLWDDNDFSRNELYKLTYYLCYVYSRCTRSISAPAPVRYADLVAYRASECLNQACEEDDRSSDSGSSSASGAQRRADFEAMKNSILTQYSWDNMYFV